MIKSKSSALWRSILGKYFFRSVKHQFFQCGISGQEYLSPWMSDSSVHSEIPLILYSSHGGWWDAALAIALSNSYLHLESYGMMEEKQLKKYMFFTKVGIFSIHRQHAKSALQSLHYAADILQNSNKTLWIFPQGELVHQDIRPISLFSGQATLLKLLQTAYFSPIAIRYDFLQEQKPESYISVGKPELLHWEQKEKSSEWTAYFTEKLTNQMDMLTNDIHQQKLDAYRIWCKGPESIEKKWDSFRGIK